MPLSQASATLPDGASSLSETYQDWRVECVSDGDADRCVMAQVQVTKENGQRVISVELTAPAADQAQGVIVMPFGFALAQGVSLSIDAETEGPKFGFSTCLPQGCFVPVSIDAAMLDRLKSGGTLHIKGQPINGNETVDYPISLKGFTAAFNRLNALR
ncbi:invasion associated locus B family protein [Martelella lutilitoris]|uniref:Invasion associated locus B family protein n=2 Tax=Martelella lutilitoris TaxID=2583532 RepID=A0A5C4JRR8_9HYPH|nr:invasion associated locus B family protein [Martelella lutilitoris]